MTVLATQRLVARLLMDAHFRQQFLDEGLLALGDADLTDVEQRGMEELRGRQRRGLEFSSTLLLGRREQSLRGLLPATLRLLGANRSSRLWADYGHQARAEGISTVTAEALAFARFLEDHFDSRNDELLSAVRRFERRKLEIYESRNRTIEPHTPEVVPAILESTIAMIPDTYALEVFAFDVTQIATWLKTQSGTLSIPAIETTVLFYIDIHTRRPAAAKVSGDMAALIEFCDGRRNIGQIARALVKPGAREPDVLRLCQAAVRELERHGAMRIAPFERSG